MSQIDLICRNMHVITVAAKGIQIGGNVSFARSRSITMREQTDRVIWENPAAGSGMLLFKRETAGP